MWGVIPAAGAASRFQPLGFSKELLPIGTRMEDGREVAVAAAEHALERLAEAGVSRFCIIISAAKTDILRHFGSGFRGIPIAYVVQAEPRGLCHALFAANFLTGEEDVAVALPDTLWFPKDALRRLPSGCLAFLLFPSGHAQAFDAVITDGERVREIRVKSKAPGTQWIWGAFRMPGPVFASLHQLWLTRGDEYVGSLANAWLAQGGEALGIKAGEAYADAGTPEGWRAAMQLARSRG